MASPPFRRPLGGTDSPWSKGAKQDRKGCNDQDMARWTRFYLRLAIRKQAIREGHMPNFFLKLSFI